MLWVVIGLENKGACILRVWVLCLSHLYSQTPGMDLTIVSYFIWGCNSNVLATITPHPISLIGHIAAMKISLCHPWFITDPFLGVRVMSDYSFQSSWMNGIMAVNNGSVPWATMSIIFKVTFFFIPKKAASGMEGSVKSDMWLKSHGCHWWCTYNQSYFYWCQSHSRQLAYNLRER